MVSLIPSFMGYNGSSNDKYISPTICASDSMSDNSLKLHQANSTASNSARNQLSKRFVEPIGIEVKEANYKVNVPDFANLPPLQLGSKLISNINKIDSSIPHDIYYSESLSKTESSLDNYYFDYENGLKDFSRFEKVEQIDLPDTFFEQHNQTECSTKIGLFPEIERTWIAVDNKLMLWNYRIPQSSFNKSSQFLTIDQIQNTVLAVKLVKPKEGVFAKEINHLLVVATTTSIQIFLIKYDKALNNLEVLNLDLSVSTHGLAVDSFVVHPKTNDIFFSGETDGVNIWRLDYSNKSTFTKNRCDKVCLTKAGFSSVIPFSGFGFASGTSITADSSAKNIPERIVQLEIDGSRDILYSLSNKSVIRVYKLLPKQDHLTEGSTLTPNQIFKSASAIFVDASNFKVFERFKIISIHRISPEESSIVQLIATTSNGSRILLKLGSTTTFSTLLTSSLSAAQALKLNLVNIKFPPAREIPTINNELDAFTRDRQYISQVIANQQKSQLLKNAKIAKIISPGVFLCVKKTKRSDKLFIASANFGYLKKNNKLVEDAEFTKYTANEDAPYTYIQDIVQLTPSMNATNTPNGYSNVAASQYTKEPLRFAILTNFGLVIYQFKTSDQILRSLTDEVIENFIEENGYEETCSTLLYLACSYGQYSSNDIFQRKAQVLFSTCGNNARLTETRTAPQPTSLIPHHASLQNYTTHPTVDQVILSDRLYGTCLLMGRFLRDIWDKKVFGALPSVKITPTGSIEIASIKDNKVVIGSLNIDKNQIEYFIGTIVVLIDFFVQNESNIQGLSAPNYSSDPNQFENEVCLRAESIAFTSIFKSLTSMKEAFSFLMVVLEELQCNQNNFNALFEFLSLTNQANLLTISFRDLLLPSRDVKALIKDLLSSIINSNISRGGSIDFIASSLQTRCGSFCSTNDVFIFKAIENLTRAKKIASRDSELKLKCLRNSVLLFEEAYETLTLDHLTYAVDVMVDLEYYSGAIGMLLDIAKKLGNNVKPPNFAYSQVNESLISKDHLEIESKVRKIYDTVFSVLQKVDNKALKVVESNNQLLINSFFEIRDLAYDTCFASKSEEFQYAFYDWFIDQGISDRLLDVNTSYILPYLEKRSESSVALSNVLWLYYAKRERYYDAAKILYALSISQFNLELAQRIEYLSRANGFCNCVCPPNLRQEMIQLSSTIHELFDVANVQLSLLNRIERDSRISKENKARATESLNFKILPISDLFNTYVDPLGYYDLSLLIFKISDYKNSDDILKRWELLFDKLLHDSKTSKEPFYVLLSDEFTLNGPKLSSNDIVFPVEELVKLVKKNLKKAIESESVSQKPAKGFMTDLLMKAGVSAERLAYIADVLENEV
ncbi:NUP170 [Candida margitis]|uniref:NUP170 n=1 Tax=Candida margitis TaxID=1775924 RepID=UPI002227EC89|nr:NUP170 [Candida margitis]KAI5969138.1 NUP170 [Candida margitis]